VSRLVSRLIEQGIFTPEHSFRRHVLVTNVDPTLRETYLSLVGRMRRAGIPTEAFLENSALGAQLKYASRKGYGYAVIFGAEEQAKNVAQLKELATGKQRAVAIERLIDELL
jgi:histidyl-tRNA synthetase